MYGIFATLIIICSILLVLIILIQNPKGGGLSSSFGGGTQMMGVKKTTDFLEKSTWTLAISLIVLILASNFAINRPDSNEIQTTKGESSEIDIRTEEISDSI